MSEHTHIGIVSEGWSQRWVRLPHDWPAGIEVTVTWTEPPEPTGRWVVADGAGGEFPAWQDADGNRWRMFHLVGSTSDEAEAALVDLIETDHPSYAPPDELIDDTCSHGRPNHQVLVAQLDRALHGQTVARPQTPRRVWGDLLDEVRDLIETDHLPPQMPNVDDIYDWMALDGRISTHVNRLYIRSIIRGTLDAIVALAAHEETPR